MSGNKVRHARGLYLSVTPVEGSSVKRVHTELGNVHRESIQ